MKTNFAAIMVFCLLASPAFAMGKKPSPESSTAACKPFQMKATYYSKLKVLIQFSCVSSTEGHYSYQLGHVEEPTENHIFIAASDYPTARDTLDSEISKRFDSGVPRKDLVIYRETILPILKAAQQETSPDEQMKLRIQARDIFEEHLVKSN